MITLQPERTESAIKEHKVANFRLQGHPSFAVSRESSFCGIELKKVPHFNVPSFAHLRLDFDPDHFLFQNMSLLEGFAMAVIATELKFTAVVAIYAIFKFLEQNGVLAALSETRLDALGDYSMLTVINDGVFYVGHSFLYNRYMRSSEKVLKDTAISTKDKVSKNSPPL